MFHDFPMCNKSTSVIGWWWNAPSVFTSTNLGYRCDWSHRQITAAPLYAQRLSCRAQPLSRWAGAPAAVRHGSLLVYCLAARDSRRGPPPLAARASSLNVSPSSCSRTAQHICFLYYVLLRRSLAVTMFLCTFYPVLWETVCCSQHETVAVTIIFFILSWRFWGWLECLDSKTD